VPIVNAVVLTCGQCTAELPPGARFCPQCGAPTGEAPAAPPTSPLGAATLSEEVGAHFAGPLVLGAMARFASSDAARRQALRDGERLLQEPCVSHCHFTFYTDAIEASLAAAQWSEAERYAGLLDEYARREPLPLIDLLVARGRALARPA